MCGQTQPYTAGFRYIMREPVQILYFPQTTSAWAGPAAINATPASGAYLKIRAQLEKDGVVLLGNAAADALYIPLAVDWERGKKYIYTLEFNGDSALSPISFDMTVSNWTDAAAQEIEF